MSAPRRKSPSHIERYARSDAERILAAYSEILPQITPQLRRYLNLDRARPWGLLTSDFHRTKLPQYEALSAEVEKLEGEMRKNHPVPAAELARRMSMLCSESGLGFSFGICPWTDHALHCTYGKSPGRRLVILVGHDWYPVVPKRAVEPHSLSWPMRQDGLHRMPEVLPPRAELYFSALTEPLLSGALGTLLFVNIYPDYREPEERTTGPVKAGYGGCLEGFEALLAATRPHYKSDDVTILSWGSTPWNLLRRRTAIRHPGSIMEVTEQLAGKILELRTGGQAYRYLPMAHPSEGRNAHIGFHVEHVRGGLASLGFGTPMASPTPRARPAHWKQRPPMDLSGSTCRDKTRNRQHCAGARSSAPPPDGIGSRRALCAKARNVLTSALLNVEQIVALQGITVFLRRTCNPPRRCLNPSRCLLTLRIARQVAARHLCALLGATIEKGSP